MGEQSNQTIENCKMELKTFTKLKLQAESELLKLRNQEQSITEQLLNTQNEVDFFMQEMEDIKSQITQTKHQISMIDICTKSEETKIEKYTNTLIEHKKAYETIFEKERDIIELRNKRKKEKEVEEEEQMKQKEREINEKNEQIAKDAVIVEGECEAIEKECVVLKKRNNAIMLKLRRMLVETEKARREMRKQNADIHPE